MVRATLCTPALVKLVVAASDLVAACNGVSYEAGGMLALFSAFRALTRLGSHGRWDGTRFSRRHYCDDETSIRMDELGLDVWNEKRGMFVVA
jgi:hypothetical protein